MFRLAVAQSPADLEGPEARLDWLRTSLPAIAEAGADLVLLPELFACGYNIGAQLPLRAEARNGPTFAAMADMAGSNGIALLYGYAERDGDTLYNAALCVSPKGEILSHQRKLAIPPGFERQHFAPGTGCDLFDYGGLRIATLICYDAEFPETVRHVSALGAQLILVPTALGAQWGWVATRMIPTRAYENGVYLAYANSAGTENGLAFLGASMIANPDGTEAARAEAAPTVLYADLDPDRVSQAQSRLPYLKDRLTLGL
jgi:predicted amidohydrolase